MNQLDPRYIPESTRLLEQLEARGVYAPRLLLPLLSQAQDIKVEHVLAAFDAEQDARNARDPRDTIGAAIYAPRRAILRRWPDPPAADLP